MIKKSPYKGHTFSIVVAIMMLSVVLLAGGARAEDTSIPIHVDIFIDNKTISLSNSGNFFVTILSTNGFNANDPATGVNFSSVRFQGIPPFNEDKSDKVNLKLHFHGGSEIQCGNDRTVYLIGTTFDGRKIVGWVNNVAIVGCKYQSPGAPKITTFLVIWNYHFNLKSLYIL